MSKKTRKYFANGAGCATKYDGSDVMLLDWNGRPDGSARYIPHVKMYARNGKEYRGMAALLRAVEAEHANQ